MPTLFQPITKTGESEREKQQEAAKQIYAENIEQKFSPKERARALEAWIDSIKSKFPHPPQYIQYRLEWYGMKLDELKNLRHNPFTAPEKSKPASQSQIDSTQKIMPSNLAKAEQGRKIESEERKKIAKPILELRDKTIKVHQALQSEFSSITKSQIKWNEAFFGVFGQPEYNALAEQLSVAEERLESFKKSCRELSQSAQEGTVFNFANAVQNAAYSYGRYIEAQIDLETRMREYDVKPTDVMGRCFDAALPISLITMSGAIVTLGKEGLKRGVEAITLGMVAKAAVASVFFSGVMTGLEVGEDEISKKAAREFASAPLNSLRILREQLAELEKKMQGSETAAYKLSVQKAQDNLALAEEMLKNPTTDLEFKKIAVLFVESFVTSLAFSTAFRAISPIGARRLGSGPIDGLMISPYRINPTEANPYSVLGVPLGAPWSMIKQAYRRLSKLYHPDLAHGDPAQMKKINNAYDFFRDLHERQGK